MTLNGLDDAQLRRSPGSGQNALTWVLWHVARSEDLAVTVLTGREPQLLRQGNWLEQLNLTRCDTGTAMTPDECAALNAQIDIAGLRAYRAAIAARTRAVVTALKPEQLAEVVNPEHYRATFADGVIGSERARWLEQFFANQSKGWWLSFISWHGAEHLLGEAQYIRSQNGVAVGI